MFSCRSPHAGSSRDEGVCQTLGDVLQSEQAHSGVTVHCPFLGFTVWLAAVVHEASLVPFGSCVNDPILQDSGPKMKGSRGENSSRFSFADKKIWGEWFCNVGFS